MEELIKEYIEELSVSIRNKTRFWTPYYKKMFYTIFTKELRKVLKLGEEEYKE